MKRVLKVMVSKIPTLSIKRTTTSYLNSLNTEKTMITIYIMSIVWSCILLNNVRREIWKYQMGNKNPYIEEEPTTQWKSTKGQTTIYETYR